MKPTISLFLSALAALTLAGSFEVRQIARPDGPLEPSLQNEVDHAISRAEAWLANRFDGLMVEWFDTSVTNQTIKPSNHQTIKPSNDLFGTNGLYTADIALKLISSQKGAGWWITPTNSVPTRLAIEILKNL